MITIYINCDHPLCQQRISRKVDNLFGNKSSLIQSARLRGWQVGKDHHFCPQHRTRKAPTPDLSQQEHETLDL